MAISTIKRDENGTPSRAKHQIVVLSNLDMHECSKSDYFAPIMSQMEMRLLLAIAVQHRCLPKSGDFFQAFCQLVLPNTEQYVCQPSSGLQLHHQIPTYISNAPSMDSRVAPNIGLTKQQLLLNY